MTHGKGTEGGRFEKSTGLGALFYNWGIPDFVFSLTSSLAKHSWSPVLDPGEAARDKISFCPQGAHSLGGQTASKRNENNCDNFTYRSTN